MKYSALHNGKIHYESDSLEQAVTSVIYMRDNAPYDKSLKLSIRDNETGIINNILPPEKKR